MVWGYIHDDGDRKIPDDNHFQGEQHRRQPIRTAVGLHGGKTRRVNAGVHLLAAPSTPNLQRKRSFLNRSWMVSSSHLVKTRHDGEFKAQVDYSNDRVTAQGRA